MKILCLGHHIVWQEFAKLSEGYSASIFRYQDPPSWHLQTKLHGIKAENATIVTKKNLSWKSISTSTTEAVVSKRKTGTLFGQPC
jgi:hypothetical protein